MHPEVRLPSFRNVLRWLTLMALSAILMAALEVLNLPAALLLGAMGAAIALAATGTSLAVSPPLFLGAQAIIGCMIAQSMPVSLLAEIAKDWPVFVGGIVSVIAAAAVLGAVLARFAVLPGTTAVWGTSPGAAAAMTLMAAEYGADIRLVALMQYLRVSVVTLVAAVVAKIWAPAVSTVAATTDWFPPLRSSDLAATLAIAAAGAFLGRWLRIASGALLVPLFAGMTLQAAGLVAIDLPPWLLASAYAVIGWGIGLRFDRGIVRHAARVLPIVLGSTLALVAFCGGLAALFVYFGGMAPLTAYLAMSPGGVDTVAIIAQATKADMPFVMSMQTTRLLLLLVLGPAISRFVAAHAVGPFESD